MVKKYLTICILFLSLPTLILNAQAETKTITSFVDTLDIPWGYLYQINRKTPDKDTTVTITIISNVVVDLFVADRGDTDLYLDGETIYVYVDERNFTSEVFTFILEKKQNYEFVIENYHDHIQNAIVYIKIDFEYEPSYLWILWVFVGITGFVGFVFLMRYRSKKQQFKHDESPSYRIYETPSSYSQKTSHTELTAAQKYCESCGFSSDFDAKYCTNCGAPLD